MSKKLICTKAGVHGKVFRVGDISTAEELKSLGGMVPDYFVPVDSPEGMEADADNNGKITVKEMKDFLSAKGVQFPPNAKKADLEALMAEAAKVAAAPEAASGITGAGSATEGRSPLD